MALFKNGEPEVILLFIREYWKTHRLLEKLPQLRAFSIYAPSCMDKRSISLRLSQMQSVPPLMEVWTKIIMGLGMYYFSINVISNKKRTMSHAMYKLHTLKIRRYALRLENLNDYLSVLSVSYTTKNMGKS